MYIGSSSFNSNTSLSFYHNYLKLQLLINRENNYNTNTTKYILGEFLKCKSCLILYVVHFMYG